MALPYKPLAKMLYLMCELLDILILTYDQNDDLIRQLLARVAELEAHLSKNSHNSRKP